MCMYVHIYVLCVLSCSVDSIFAGIPLDNLHELNFKRKCCSVSSLQYTVFPLCIWSRAQHPVGFVAAKFLKEPNYHCDAANSPAE